MNASHPIARGAAIALAIVMLTFTVIQAQGCQDSPPPKATPKAPKVETKTPETKAPEGKTAPKVDTKTPESQPAPESQKAPEGKGASTAPKRLKLDPTFMPATKSGPINMKLRAPGMLQKKGGTMGTGTKRKK